MFATALFAQAPASPYADLTRVYGRVKDNLEQLAGQMPEEGYKSSPTPDMRSFAALIAHIADTQARYFVRVFAAYYVGNPPQHPLRRRRLDLIAALKNSSSICDAAFDWLTPANAGLPAPAAP